MGFKRNVQSCNIKKFKMKMTLFIIIKILLLLLYENLLSQILSLLYFFYISIK